MTKSLDLVCLGNPLLDYQVDVDEAYLAKYGLKPNNTILLDFTSTDMLKIFDEIAMFPNVHFIAGGSAQNTARGAAYVLGEGHVGFIGSVGKDKFSDILLKKNKEAGVDSMYQVIEHISTGRCAALITGHNRSLVTELGAAKLFKSQHIDEIWDVIENTKMFYIEGFKITACLDSVLKLGLHAQQTGKPFIMNFSASFIPEFFKAELEKCLPYATHIIGNEVEAASYAKAFNLDCDPSDLVSIAKHLARDSNRTVIFTHEVEPTVVVSKGCEYIYPVEKLDETKIIDTNGAGDSFAGGFVAGLIQGKSMDQAIKMGQWLASLSIQEVGASYPTHKFCFPE